MKKKRIKDIVLICIILLLVLVMLYSGLQILESTVLHPVSSVADQTTSKTITRNGVDYFPRQDITVVMVLGIDQYGPVESSNYYRNNGLADSIMLLIFDEANEEYSVLHLNRDTMVDMDVLGMKGEYAGTAYGQLALAHTYGTGLEDSCENMKNTIMNFIPGLSIDYYVAMNMDAIPIMNDAVGGVDVTVVDDFSAVDPSIQMGDVTLWGQQALYFVQTRRDVGTQMNVSRMERQKEYMRGFISSLNGKLEQSSSFALDTYNQIAPYIVSDCSANTLNALVSRFSDYSAGDIVSPEGENVKGETYMEFYVDEEALDQLALDLFYREKK